MLAKKLVRKILPFVLLFSIFAETTTPAEPVKSLRFPLGIFLLGEKPIPESYFMVHTELNKNNMTLFIPSSEYLKYKIKNHRENASLQHLAGYVTYKDNIVKKIAEHITKDCSSKEKACQTISDFVQQVVKYDATIETGGKKNYTRYPIETLVERNGDCEDTAILAGAFMKSIGIDIILIYLDDLELNKGHVALGVNGDFSGATYLCADGKIYYHAETSSTNWPKAEW